MREGRYSVSGGWRPVPAAAWPPRAREGSYPRLAEREEASDRENYSRSREEQNECCPTQSKLVLSKPTDDLKSQNRCMPPRGSSRTVPATSGNVNSYNNTEDEICLRSPRIPLTSLLLIGSIVWSTSNLIKNRPCCPPRLSANDVIKCLSATWDVTSTGVCMTVCLGCDVIRSLHDRLPGMWLSRHQEFCMIVCLGRDVIRSLHDRLPGTRSQQEVCMIVCWDATSSGVCIKDRLPGTEVIRSLHDRLPGTWRHQEFAWSSAWDATSSGVCMIVCLGRFQDVIRSLHDRLQKTWDVTSSGVCMIVCLGRDVIRSLHRLPGMWRHQESARSSAQDVKP